MATPRSDPSSTSTCSSRTHKPRSALCATGFVEVGNLELFKDIHHQRPLWLPGFPLTVELHHEPKWPERLGSAPGRELLDAAIPSGSGVEGISTLPAAHHALALAAHSWAHLRFGGSRSSLTSQP